MQAQRDLTPALVAEINAYAKSVGAAADANARAKLASQIDFNRQTALLDPSEVAIAQQLVSIYGNKVPEALASSEAAAIRLNNALKLVGDAERTAFTSFLGDLGQGKTAMEALSNA